MPRNAATGQRYRGINVLTLTTGFFYKRLELRDDKTDGFGPEGDEETVRRIPLLRAFTLFHASQIDGIPDYIPRTIAEAPWRAPEAMSLRCWCKI